MSKLTSKIKKIAKRNRLFKNFIFGWDLYKFYSQEHKINKFCFYVKNYHRIRMISFSGNKALQFKKLASSIDITPIQESRFFYAIDCFKTVELKNRILDNYTIDYDMVVNFSIDDLLKMDKHLDSAYTNQEKTVVSALQMYLERVKKNVGLNVQYGEAIKAMESLFYRRAESLFEGIQRILFVNQFLWQTNRKHNGLGRLYKILDRVYEHDIKKGVLTRQSAKKMILDLFKLLHENYWFKSNMLLGDTGQIIVLGGVDKDKKYFVNELTYIFLEVSKELKFPDPKVLLRYSRNIPEELFKLALECISTGIGAPLISNDDVIIPALKNYGYREDAENYVTSACWEPLIAGNSCDQNNIKVINFAKPLVLLLSEHGIEKIHSFEQLVSSYEISLGQYLSVILNELSELVFEEDPFISLFSSSAMKAGKNITRGGAKYNNLGLTSVGMESLVNSLFYLNRYVFQEKRYKLKEISDMVKKNFENQERLLKELSETMPCYGVDDEDIIALTNRIMQFVSKKFRAYKTKLNGNFKFGLSSPNYIEDARSTGATFDGRKKGEPFAVHISSRSSVALTSLLSFASKLDYNENRINGNVVDFFVIPTVLKENFNKYELLIKNAFLAGVYQMQINVVDSQTLIMAKKDPNMFPNLIVRVWGFSAYFNDLPEEYKELLIKRALENEAAA